MIQREKMYLLDYYMDITQIFTILVIACFFIVITCKHMFNKLANKKRWMNINQTIKILTNLTKIEKKKRINIKVIEYNKNSYKNQALYESYNKGKCGLFLSLLFIFLYMKIHNCGS